MTNFDKEDSRGKQRTMHQLYIKGEGGGGAIVIFSHDLNQVEVILKSLILAFILKKFLTAFGKPIVVVLG